MTNSSTHRKVVIAGGSGFLGISLATHLTAGNRGGDPEQSTTAGSRNYQAEHSSTDIGGAHGLEAHATAHDTQVVLLSRSAPKVTGPWRHRYWDGRNVGDWREELDGATAVVNLAGRSVDCIKTPDHQDEIYRSRVESTRCLGQAMRSLNQPPPVWVQMGTAHIYGDPPSAVCTEGSAFGVGLAPLVGRAWEEAFEASRLPHQRGVTLRTSFVVGRDRGAGGGALSRLRTLVRWGLGGTVGSGTQGMSWIHELDMNRLFERAIEDDSMNGAYIASSPNPVSQRDFMRTLRREVGMPIGLPAFEWMVRIGAPLIMKTDPELALYGRYVKPQRLLENGFTFQFPDLEPALRDLVVY